MNAVCNYIIDLLHDDMVSHGLLAQCVEDAKGSYGETDWDEVLKELLLSGEVEIGVAKSVSPDYVEFVAWQGTVDERIARAIEAVKKLIGTDQEFAYWLCLRENVDRFESEESSHPS